MKQNIKRSVSRSAAAIMSGVLILGMALAARADEPPQTGDYEEVTSYQDEYPESESEYEYDAEYPIEEAPEFEDETESEFEDETDPEFEDETVSESEDEIVISEPEFEETASELEFEETTSEPESIEDVSFLSDGIPSYEETPLFGNAYIHSSAVPVHRYPDGASEVLALLSNGTKIYVMSWISGKDGTIWYKIRFITDDYAYLGFIDSAHATYAPDSPAVYSNISAFPASYQPALQALKEAHPNWVFEPFFTGLDWKAAVNGELTIEIDNNLVTSTASFAPTGFRDLHYYGTDASGLVYNYDWSNNTWYNWEPGWYAVSEEGLSYCMDPRNFLTEDLIFMFEQMSYGNQQEETVEQVLVGTFMSETVITDDTTEGEPISMTYAELFVWIGQQYNINPIMLASRVRQEQGAGTSPLISGTYPGFEGLYNYFNMGASGHTTEEIIRNGLTEARNGSTMILPNGDSYTGSWNSRVKALIGGALKMAARYLDKNQDTLYLQKFDVVSDSNGLYWSQYMQNVQAPYSEGRSAYNAYLRNDLLDSAFVFRIPVFDNMNESNPRPGKITHLRSIRINGTELMEAYDYSTTTYRLTIPDSTGTLTIDASAIDETVNMEGTGTYTVYPGVNQFNIKVSAEDSISRTYTLIITCTSVPPQPISHLSAALVSNNYVSLSWNPVIGAEWYAVYRMEDGQAQKFIASTSATSYKDTSIVSGVKYTYRIYPYYKQNGSNVMAPSATVYATAMRLEGPQNVAASSSSSGIRLTWSPLDNANGYIIYRRVGSTGSFSYLYMVSGCEFTDTSAPANEYCFYRVFPYYIGNTGSRMTGKAIGYAYQRIPINRVDNLWAVGVPGGVQISWAGINDADGYIIYGERYGEPYQFVGMTTDKNTTTYTDKKASQAGINSYWVFPYQNDTSSGETKRIIGPRSPYSASALPL